MDKLARKIERSIVHHAKGRRPKTLLSVSSNFTDGSAISIVLHGLTSSQLVDFENNSSVEDLLRELRHAAEMTKYKRAEEQNKIYGRIQQRLEAIGYDFWVLLVDRSDEEFVRIDAHIIRGEFACKGRGSESENCFSTADYIEEKVERSVVEAERVAVAIGVEGLVRRFEQTTFGLGSGGVLERFPGRADVTQTAVFAEGASPHLLLEGAYIKGGNFSTASDSNLSGDQREYTVNVLGEPFHYGRLGVVAGASYRNLKETVVDQRFPDSPEASAEFSSSDVSLGVGFGNLVNGVSVRALTTYSTAKDTSPSRVFFGLPSDLWTERGYGGELRLKHTTRGWEFDFRARQVRTMREFGAYFPGLGKANLDGTGFRAEVRKRWRTFGIGAVWSQSELRFADTPPVAPQAHAVAEQKDSFIALTMSYRWHPD
jgi:hypothetical protein